MIHKHHRYQDHHQSKESLEVVHIYNSRTITWIDLTVEAENSRRAATSRRFWFDPTAGSTLTAEISPPINGLRTSPCRRGTPCLSAQWSISLICLCVVYKLIFRWKGYQNFFTESIYRQCLKKTNLVYKSAISFVILRIWFKNKRTSF